MAKFTIEINNENERRATDVLAALYHAGIDGVTEVHLIGALMSLLLALDLKVAE